MGNFDESSLQQLYNNIKDCLPLHLKASQWHLCMYIDWFNVGEFTLICQNHLSFPSLKFPLYGEDTHTYVHAIYNFICTLDHNQKSMHIKNFHILFTFIHRHT